ncbi:MAG: hypothetical protein V6Z81_04395 [Parvularculales bacterium]
MKTLTTFAATLVMAFALSGPAQAMDEIFENVNTDWLGDGSFELIEDLSFNLVTPAHAGQIGEGFKNEFDSWGNAIEDWWAGPNALLGELEEINAVSPAHAIGDLGSCVFAECAGREDEYIGDFLVPADER